MSEILGACVAFLIAFISGVPLADLQSDSPLDTEILETGDCV